jgi:hypothetical protein
LSGELTAVVGPVYIGAVGAAVIAGFVAVCSGLLEPDGGVGRHGCGGDEVLDVPDEGVSHSCCYAGSEEEGGWEVELGDEGKVDFREAIFKAGGPCFRWW